jgi:hypothetical protein
VPVTFEHDLQLLELSAAVLLCGCRRATHIRLRRKEQLWHRSYEFAIDGEVVAALNYVPLPLQLYAGDTNCNFHYQVYCFGAPRRKKQPLVVSHSQKFRNALAIINHLILKK